MSAFSIDEAMAIALDNLNRISCHFRKHEQHTAANELGKLSVQIVNAFSNGVDQLPPDQHAFSGLITQIERINKENVTSHAGILQQISCSDEKASQQPESWAQVASTSATSVSGLQTYCPEPSHYMTPQSLTSASVSRHSQNSDDDGSDPQLPSLSGVALPSATEAPEIPEAKAGVIRIYGRISKDLIQFITTRIHEGPLQDVRLETNGRTRVTFQHASHALAFLKSNQEMEHMLGFGRFGCGYHVELAEVLDWNEDLRRMNQPIRERRRLSFARKRLFAENMSPEKWKQDVRTLAGPGNIDFLWVFNSGNATAIFTSTVVARKVLEVFNRWKDGRNVYSGVSVTFSSDPCEKELVLVKETSRPGLAKGYVKRSMR
ncbi:hypothetical protein P170DRAFT_500225 [Aspergillus steynii IBT 23096]|uniref:RRM domain-containing protein n=1 Tax=Aspergillus steynii IBT 23096 TaxID=1392250 RepID=A0A2I2FYE0_9EURO|nr:uncharacterized protein P170DRAFT_500225 [Aspergillus steynii IBT 23096]PLB45638.1 hypothetical protein P170DRAFT_500225 [Aspergillus steynii IBT 23096]